uniref:Cotton fiber protein n=1 Tax=Opuntia streptacantha TaxID=393608 RepID=A0A7C8ZA12_OPUST
MMTANKAPSLLKKIMAAWSSKRNELRVRIMIFFLLHKNMDKTSLARSFSHSLQALVTPPHHYPKKKYDVEDSQVNRLMYYNKLDGSRIHSGSYATNIEQEEDPDLTRVLFEESEAAMEEEAGAAEDVIECRWGPEVVKEVMEVEEENVDEAAEMFIKRFKREIQLQKQQSLEY